MKNEKLAWLAGLWDGEGTITVFKTMRTEGKGKGNYRYHPAIVLCNCDENIISESVKILDELEIRMFLFKKISDTEKHKDSYTLNTRKLNTVKRFCEIFLPYLVGKKAQAELTLRFINSRLAKLEKNGHWNQGTEYDESEISLCDQLKKLNQKGKNKSSTAIRLTSSDEDMV